MIHHSSKDSLVVQNLQPVCRKYRSTRIQYNVYERISNSHLSYFLPALPECLELVQAVDHAGAVLPAGYLVDAAVALVEGMLPGQLADALLGVVDGTEGYVHSHVLEHIGYLAEHAEDFSEPVRKSFVDLVLHRTVVAQIEYPDAVAEVRTGAPPQG